MCIMYIQVLKLICINEAIEFFIWTQSLFLIREIWMYIRMDKCKWIQELGGNNPIYLLKRILGAAQHWLEWKSGKGDGETLILYMILTACELFLQLLIYFVLMKKLNILWIETLIWKMFCNINVWFLRNCSILFYFFFL